MSFAGDADAGGGDGGRRGGSSPFVFDVTPLMWGGDVGVGYRGMRLFEGLDTITWAYAGASIERMSYFRLPDGSLITQAAPPSVNPATDPYFWREGLRWQLGLAQGLVWNRRLDSNLLEAFIFYRGRLEANMRDAADPGQLIFLSRIPDRDGIFQGSILAGLSFNDVAFDRRSKASRGAAAEVSVESGPPWLGNASGSYARFNASGRAFFPVSRAADAFSLYLGEFLDADFAFGSPVPLDIRQTFGGRDPRIGLGNAVRGVDIGAYDTNLKLVNNLELRMNLPAVVFPDLVPGALLFWDVGYYAQVGEPGAPGCPPNGILSSVGMGVFLDLLDLAWVSAYLEYRLTGVNADGTALTPPWVFSAIEFSLKF